MDIKDNIKEKLKEKTKKYLDAKIKEKHIGNMSYEEQAERDFNNSTEKRHYPDDGLYQKYEKVISDWNAYMRAWRECWEREYDRKHGK